MNAHERRRPELIAVDDTLGTPAAGQRTRVRKYQLSSICENSPPPDLKKKALAPRRSSRELGVRQTPGPA
jgi:hypothetical protein